MIFGTPAYKIPQRKPRLKTAYILKIDELEVFTESEIKEAVVKASDNKQMHMLVTFTKDEAANSLTGASLPHLYFDIFQMQLMP
jgi:hypothetical protein